MILGVEHIALSCDNLLQSIDAVKTLGYTDKFVQKDLPNDLAKTDLLRTYEPFHSIAYCQKPDSISIELTQHSEPLKQSPSFYQVHFAIKPEHCSNGIQSALLPALWQSSLDLQSPQSGIWSPFKSVVWYENALTQPASNAITSIALQVRNLKKSYHFWTEALACRPINQGNTNGQEWSVLSIVSPVPSWSLKVVLVESQSPSKKPFLDDSGFPCLALITNNLKQDAAKALQAGGHSSANEFISSVNGKILQIQLVRGPDQELIELIEFQR
jgi:hypothetical protein